MRTPRPDLPPSLQLQRTRQSPARPRENRDGDGSTARIDSRRGGGGQLGRTARGPDHPKAIATGRSASRALALAHERIIACTRCARLRTYCARIAREKKAAHRADEYWGLPVPGFGDPEARLLVLGLAPAAHGANRTGRVFTGDGSGDFLMRAMHATGFASIPTSRRADDGLVLRDAYIAAAVRCAPPDNKPSPEEIAACHDHLVAEAAALPQLRAIVCLGRIAFDAAWRLLASRGLVVRPRPVFGHGLAYYPAGAPAVIASYHPSRQNTNTGKLTPSMLQAVFETARRAIERL